MSQTDSQIEHPGVIRKLDDEHVYVLIESASACGNCHSASYCGMSEMEEKVVEVPNLKDQDLFVGKQVVVTLDKSLGFRALFFGYLLPFLILLAGIIVSMAFSANEPLSALIGISLMIPYYGWLYVSRHTFRKRFRFQIRKQEAVI
jgi:sigma-E factor negative regulatory protein RseC